MLINDRSKINWSEYFVHVRYPGLLFHCAQKGPKSLPVGQFRGVLIVTQALHTIRNNPPARGWGVQRFWDLRFLIPSMDSEFCRKIVLVQPESKTGRFILFAKSSVPCKAEKEDPALSMRARWV